METKEIFWFWISRCLVGVLVAESALYMLDIASGYIFYRPEVFAFAEENNIEHEILLTPFDILASALYGFLLAVSQNRFFCRYFEHFNRRMWVFLTMLGTIIWIVYFRQGHRLLLALYYSNVSSDPEAGILFLTVFEIILSVSAGILFIAQWVYLRTLSRAHIFWLMAGFIWVMGQFVGTPEFLYLTGEYSYAFWTDQYNFAVSAILNTLFIVIPTSIAIIPICLNKKSSKTSSEVPQT